MRTVILALGLLCGTATAATPWSAFNGFHAGMSKEAAKAAGYVNCRQSDGRHSSSDSIICDIPAGKRALGSLGAEVASLEFASYNVNVVKEIHVTFQAKLETVKAELTRVYGQPEDGGSHYVWHRNAADSVELFKRQRGTTAYVTFKYNKAVGDARAKQAKNEAKKKAALKTF